MKKYQETIQKMADKMYDDYMGGAQNYFPSDTHMVAYIYGVEIDKAETDVLKVFSEMRDEHFQKMENK